MKVYIATSFRNRELARQVRAWVESQGHESTARWIDTHLEEMDLMTPEDQAQEALSDLTDISGSDLVLLVTLGEPSSTGGMHFEAGYAYALGKDITVLGPDTNIFHALLAEVTVWPA